MAEHESESIIEAVLKLKHRDPFVPFDVTMTSGEAFKIENPDSLAVGATYLYYCLPRSHVVYLRVNQIVSIRDPIESGLSAS